MLTLDGNDGYGYCSGEAKQAKRTERMEEQSAEQGLQEYQMQFALKSAKAVAKRKAREKHLNGGLRDEMDGKKKRKKAKAGKAEPQVGIVAAGVLRSDPRLIVKTMSYLLDRCNAAIV